jgi:hypothetical protein
MITNTKYYMDRSDGKMYEVVVPPSCDVSYYLEGFHNGFMSRPGGEFFANEFVAQSFYKGFHAGALLYENRESTQEAPFCDTVKRDIPGQLVFNYTDGFGTTSFTDTTRLP